MKEGAPEYYTEHAMTLFMYNRQKDLIINWASLAYKMDFRHIYNRYVPTRLYNLVSETRQQSELK